MKKYHAKTNQANRNFLLLGKRQKDETKHYQMFSFFLYKVASSFHLFEMSIIFYSLSSHDQTKI
jgi:hypothetical protein